MDCSGLLRSRFSYGAPPSTSHEHFKPTAEWQEVLPGQVCPAGLEFRMDFDSGKNWARLPLSKRGCKGFNRRDNLPSVLKAAGILDGAESSSADAAVIMALQTLDELGAAAGKLATRARCLMREGGAGAAPLAGRSGVERVHDLRAALDVLQHCKLDAVSAGSGDGEGVVLVRKKRRALNKELDALRLLLEGGAKVSEPPAARAGMVAAP